MAEHIDGESFEVSAIADVRVRELFLLEFVLGEDHHEAAAAVELACDGELHFDLENLVFELAVEDIRSKSVVDSRIQLYFAVQLKCVTICGVSNGPLVRRKVKRVILVDLPIHLSCLALGRTSEEQRRCEK